MHVAPWPARLLGLLVALLGVFFAIEGGELALLGGSVYYVIAGIGMVAAGIETIRDRRHGVWIYGAVWLFTLIWSIAESGSDVWKLEARLFAPSVLMLLYLIPWFRPGRTARTTPRGPRDRAVYAGGAALVVVAGSAAMLALHTPGAIAQGPIPPIAAGQPTDWPAYGNTSAGDRYALVNQITPANVGQLTLAWVAHTGDKADSAEQKHVREYHSEATPLKIGDTLYTCTPHSTALALDATTGRVKWKFDPHFDPTGNGYLVCRGLSYYDASTATPAATACKHRLFLPTFNAELIALDADTGKVCAGFGTNGAISLRDHAGASPPAYQIETSPPAIVNGNVIVASRIIDNESVDEPSGVVRAYSPIDGHQIWFWDIGRSPDGIAGTLPAGQVYTRGTPNSWGAITGDAKLNMVYFGTGNATPDYYNAQRRPFDNRFGSSIVALDASTGKLRWSFQTVHHDMWDFDLPIAPSLFDMPDGTPALIQTTKTGQLFMLNRVTGKPIAPVQERAVSTRGGPPGEFVSPTQPFSVGMPSLTPAKLTPQDIWGATPIDMLVCRVEFAKARNDGIFTPTGPTPAIGNPAFDGVTDWGGAAIDTDRHVMTINTMQMPFYTQLIDKKTAWGKKLAAQGTTGGENAAALQAYAQRGTPYLGGVRAWLSPFMTPCVAPPWGKLVAIDLKTRKILWQKVFGTARDTNVFGLKYNLPLKTGTPNLGGSIITAGGLVFVGATTDQYLRAYDIASGQELWKARLPAGAQATPMSYTASDGRQYVVITAGGHGALGTRYGDETIAFALPKRS
ncbi:membrane-bound PQQ-dependent dehydrogenase, glucose/quinate/shikimate family [Sphingomonas abietis]|uniref:Membrane-bound PQQ-dependent dehydrogenase, glucose/quinate/shikimate family n=1 Tax=Sphingomonas abietis TaxID=3012344 RepID=A0ABY7NHV4_9SPHN|nr:membrane-bound PQQ-dependent dehydrogenase, glucose/quinate/shikimate family [Sphingomonas abietis]WBO21116.1 membrane-bound PQQ-dependent dehydrogenase, glucose/quinate/shikimate family [Sphingomonas abietis]